MKTHLKALFITLLVLAGLFAIYFYFTTGKNAPKPEIILNEFKPALPERTIKALNGNAINMNSFAGKIVIFNFWASWCAPCIEEVPSLVSLVKADPEIVIIAVSGDKNVDEINAFLKSFPGFNKPPIFVVHEDAKQLTEEFKVDRLPESFIFNSRGEMVKKVTGTINWHTPDSIEYFKSLRN